MDDVKFWLKGKDNGLLLCRARVYGTNLFQGNYWSGKKTYERSHKNTQRKAERYWGEDFVSVNKSLVTQACAAIPVVPLNISLI